MDIEAVFASIDEERLLETAASLIQIPSHSDTPGQEREVIRFVEDLLRRWGFEVRAQEVQEGRSNLIATMSGRDEGRSLALNGHLDIVPPGREMKDPYHPVVKDGRLYGRGAADMKGAVAAMMYTLYLLKHCGIQLRGDLYFTGVVGEETGGIGTRSLVEKGFRPDFGVVGEPTDLTLVTSHKGVEQLEIRFRGRAAHASVPEQGINAITAASDFIQRLDAEIVPRLRERSQEQVGHATLSFGLIQGGDKANMVADFCRLQIDRRWVKTERLEEVVSEIEEILRSVCDKAPGLDAEIVPLHPVGGYYGPLAVPEDHELITLAKDALNQAGILFRTSGMQGWTDAATFMHAGIPAILLGPGSVAQAHTDGEFVQVAQLIDATKCYIALTRTVCQWK